MNASAEHEVTPGAMEVEVAAGTAQCLVSGGLPQPVLWQGQWWAIRQGEDNYRPVTDPELIDQLDADRDRRERARAAAADPARQHRRTEGTG